MPKHLIYLITALDAGGAQRAMLSLLPLILRSSYNVLIVCLFEGPGQIKSRLTMLGVPWLSLGMQSRVDLGAIGRLVTILKHNKTDVLITSLFHATIIGRIAGWIARVPHIISWQHSAYLPPVRELCERITAGMSKTILADCAATRQYLTHTIRIPAHRVQLVPIGAIDLSEFPYCGPRMDRSELNVGTVGMLYPAKGYLDLIHAIPRISRVFPNVRYLFAGDGPQRKELMRECQRYGLNESVYFLGYLESVAPFLATLHLYVQPSRWEGFCISAIEAMATGLPVVASKVGGLAETIAHEKTGLLVAPGRPHELADAIVELLSAPDRARAMGRLGYEHITARYTTDALERAFMPVLEPSEGGASGNIRGS